MPFQPEVEEAWEMSVHGPIDERCDLCGSHVDHGTDFEVIRHDVAEVKAQLTAIMEVVGMIQSEVAPVMESLQSNPFLKGLLGGK